MQLKYKAKRLNCQDDEVWKIDYQDLEQGCSYDYSSCEWPHPPSFAFNPMMLLTLTKACVQRLQISSVQLRTCTVTTPRGYYALQLSRECHKFILPPALAPWTLGNPYHPFPLRLLEDHLFQATTIVKINLWPQSNWIGQAIYTISKVWYAPSVSCTCPDHPPVPYRTYLRTAVPYTVG